MPPLPRWRWHIPWCSAFLLVLAFPLALAIFPNFSFTPGSNFRNIGV
jgi:hypothetical protein